MKINTILLLTFTLFLCFGVFGQNTLSRTDHLQIGAIAPDFTLKDQNNKVVSPLKTRKPVILVFYRGDWCPFCRRQLADLRGLIKPNDKAVLFAISVDSPAKSATFARNIAADKKGDLNFQILSDPGHKTVDAFGVFDPTYSGQEFEGIPHPAVFIIDANRKIVWARIEPDYRKRPTNEELRMELDKLP